MPAWEAPAGPAQKSQDGFEYLAAYGDPDPEWVTLYTRFAGWGGHEARLIRIDEWMRMSSSPQRTAGFFRLVRTKRP